jgi:hypothetical protein
MLRNPIHCVKRRQGWVIPTFLLLKSGTDLENVLGGVGHDKRAPPEFRRHLREGPACQVRFCHSEARAFHVFITRGVHIRRDLLVRSAVQRSMIHPYRRVRQACPSVRDGCRGRRPSNRRHFHSDRSRWQRPNPEKRSNVHNHWRARFYPCHALVGAIHELPLSRSDPLPRLSHLQKPAALLFRLLQASGISRPASCPLIRGMRTHREGLLPATPVLVP